MSEQKQMQIEALSNDDIDLMMQLMRERPELTRSELRICALVHRGLTSREIANLLGCSVRNIENHRYRIGKKGRYQ